jgi:hypothetical protein
MSSNVLPSSARDQDRWEPGLVSTILPVHNRPVGLRKAFSSVLKQTYRPLEIVIVDDGSSDETPGVADELAQSFPGSARVLHQPNRGPGAAREAGRLAAQGEFIQYLDSDDLLLPRKFELQVDALRVNPGADVAYGITRLVDATGRTLSEPYKWTGRPFDRLFPALLVDRWWNTQTPLWRRSVCDRIGPWPDMRMSEDWVYDARAGALGVCLAHVNECVAVTRAHQEGRLTDGGMNADKMQNICMLIEELHACAQAAGIDSGVAEMQHFSRWAFLVARQAGSFGLTEHAERCFHVACDTANRPDWRLRMVSALRRSIGWRLTGQIFAARDALAGGQVGPKTLPLSTKSAA